MRIEVAKVIDRADGNTQRRVWMQPVEDMSIFHGSPYPLVVESVMLPFNDVYVLNVEGSSNPWDAMVVLDDVGHLYMQYMLRYDFQLGQPSRYPGLGIRIMAFCCYESFKRGHNGIVYLKVKEDTPRRHRLISFYRNHVKAYL